MKCPNCQNEIRATAKFCPFCGHKLTVAQPTQIVRPRPADAPPPAPPPAQPPAQPPPAQPPVYTPPSNYPGPVAPPYVPPVQAPPAARRRIPSLPVLGALAGVVLLALAAAWFFFLRGGGGAGVPAGDRLLFSVHPDNQGTFWAESLSSIDGDGSGVQELIFDRDGLTVGQDYADPYMGVAADGRWVSAVRLDDDGFVMTLVPSDGGAEIYSDPAAIYGDNFAPAGDNFAYTRVGEGDEGDEGEAIALVVVDSEGAAVGEWPGLVFFDYFADGQRLLVGQTDDEGLLTGLATLELPDGAPQAVVDLGDSTGDVDPFVFDDYIYYRDDDELRRVRANGEEEQTIYRFESDAPLTLRAPGFDRLLILERSGEDRGDLYVVTPDGSERARLGADVYLDPGDGGSPARAIVAAGDRVAFTTIDSEGLALYVVNADGSDRRRLVDEQPWLTFAFSPDGRRLAYIAGDDYGLAGDLSVVELPDGDTTRIARDAWSFLFLGDRLFFSTVDEPGSGNAESVIHNASVTGEEDEVIYGPEDGYLYLISPVR